MSGSSLGIISGSILELKLNNQTYITSTDAPETLLCPLRTSRLLRSTRRERSRAPFLLSSAARFYTESALLSSLFCLHRTIHYRIRLIVEFQRPRRLRDLPMRGSSHGRRVDAVGAAPVYCLSYSESEPEVLKSC